jgi:predicted Zn-dependent protease
MELLRHNQFDRALADADALVRLDPDNPLYRKRHAQIAFSAGRFADAEREARDLLRQSPAEPAVQLLLVEACRAQKKFAEAAGLLDDFLKAHPDRASALFTRGVLYCDMDEPEKAIPVLRRAMERDPGWRRSAGYQLSLALARAGHADEAARVTAEVRKLQDAQVLAEELTAQPKNAELHVRAARAFAANGEDARALQTLQRALAIDPDYAPAHAALADYYDRHGDPGRAAEHRRRAGAKS